MKRTKDEIDPAAAVESARIELAEAEAQLAAIDPNAGTVDSVLARRRELAEKIALLKERLTLATERQAEAAYLESEKRIAAMREELAELNDEIESTRERVTASLREYLRPDDAARAGFVSVQVGELEVRRVRLESAIRTLDDSIRERRGKRAMAAAQELIERRKKLIQGEKIEVRLNPWRVKARFGYADEIVRILRDFHLPAMRDPVDDQIVFVLIPHGDRANQYGGGFDLLESVQCSPGDLPPQLRAVYDRSR